MIEKIKSIGFDNVCPIDTALLPYEPSLLELCKMNSCGNYMKNYNCPPLVGDSEVLIKKARSYKTAYVFQKVYGLEDSFDFEGMAKGTVNFNKLTDEVYHLAKNEGLNFLLFGAGGCRYCEKCAAIDSLPCRCPEMARPSLESYGIQVSTLAGKCNMKYINGANTVTYFGALLI